MTNALLELYQHNTWATLLLIEHCQGLADETLDLTTPGRSGPRWERLAEGADAVRREVTTQDGWRIPARSGVRLAAGCEHNERDQPVKTKACDEH